MPSLKLTQRQLDGLAKGRTKRAANLADRRRRIAAGEKVEPIIRRTKNGKELDIISHFEKENKELNDVIKVCEDAIKQIMNRLAPEKPVSKKIHELCEEICG
jgi:hypothetical protein